MRIARLLLCLLLPLSLLACKTGESQPQSEAAPKYSFRKDGSLEILSPQGEQKAEFEIEIVRSEQDLQRGLKYRDSMEPNQGMLFIMDGQAPHPFWMQDTYLSLDIIYIDHDKQIFQIYPNTTPYSEETLAPDKINAYTLEILAGVSAEKNLQKGDIIRWQEN